MRARTTRYAALAAIATAGRATRPNQNYELRLPAACGRRVVGPATRPHVSIATTIHPRARDSPVSRRRELSTVGCSRPPSGRSRRRRDKTTVTSAAVTRDRRGTLPDPLYLHCFQKQLIRRSTFLRYHFDSDRCSLTRSPAASCPVLTYNITILYFQSSSAVFFHPCTIFTLSRSTRKYRKYYNIMFIPSTVENHTRYAVLRTIECTTRSAITGDEADDLDNLVRTSRSLDAFCVLHVKNLFFFFY